MKNLNNPTNSKTIQGLDQDTLHNVIYHHTANANVECWKMWYEVKSVCKSFGIDHETLADSEWEKLADQINESVNKAFNGRFFN